MLRSSEHSENKHPQRTKFIVTHKTCLLDRTESMIHLNGYANLSNAMVTAPLLPLPLQQQR